MNFSWQRFRFSVNSQPNKAGWRILKKLLLILIASIPGSVLGGTITWDAGSNVDLNWATPDNWSGNPALVPTIDDDVLLPNPIPGSLPTSDTLILGGGVNAAQALTLNFSANYTLSGGELLVKSGDVTVNDPAIATIDASLIGQGELTKLGTGTLVLGGLNTYEGITSIRSGTVRCVQSSGSPLSSGNVFLGGATLNIAPSSGGAALLSSANSDPTSTFTFGDSAVLSLTRNGTGTLSFTLGHLNAAANSVLVPNVSSSPGMPGGNLFLKPSSGTDPLTGLGVAEKLIVNGGVAKHPNNGMVGPFIVGLNNDANNSVDFLTYDSTKGFTRATYTAGFSSASYEIANFTSSVTASSTAAYAVRIGNGGINASPVTLTVSGGPFTVGGGTDNSGAIILNGTSGTGGGQAVLAGLPIQLPTQAAGSLYIYANLAGGKITSQITGSARVVICGPGTVNLTNSANNFTGGLVVSGGVLKLPGGIPSSSTAGALVIGANGSLDLNNTYLPVNGLWGAGRIFDTNLYSPPGPTIHFQYTGSDSTVFSGTISESTSHTTSLRIASGSLTLSGQNTYSGETALVGGVLVLANEQAIRKSIVNQSQGNLQFSGITTATIAGLSEGKGATISLQTNDPIPQPVTLSLGEVSSVYLGALTGIGGITKIGSKSFTSSGNNRYTGATTIIDGTLVLDGDNSGSTSAVTVSGGAVQFNAPSSIPGTGRSVFAGPTGSVVFKSAFGPVQSVLSTRIDPNTTGSLLLSVDSSENIDFGDTGAGLNDAYLGGVTTSPNAAISFAGSLRPGNSGYRLSSVGRLTLTATNALSGAGGLRSDRGTQTVFLRGNNSFSGATSVGTGTLAVWSMADGGIDSSIGRSANGAAQLVLDGGILQYLGTGASTDRLFSVTTRPGGGLDSSGTAALNFTNPGQIGFGSTPGSRTLVLQGYNKGNNTLACAIIDDVAGVTSLSKLGTGKWILTGANTYTGTTTVSGGTLVFAGTSNTVSGGAVSVSSGAIAQFDSPGSIPGSTRSVKANQNGIVVLNFTGPSAQADLDSVMLNRLDPTSTGVIAVNAATSNLNFDFAKAGLSVAALGAVEDVNFTGIYTPDSQQYRMGGGGAVLTFGAVIPATAAGVTIGSGGNTGTVVLTASNLHAAPTYIAAGTLRVSQIGNAGAASPLGTNVMIKLGSSSSAATLQYIGAGETTDRTIDLNGRGTLDASGTGPLIWTSDLTSSVAGSKTFVLQGSNTQENIFAGRILDNSASNKTSLAKTGLGTWVLGNSANAYSGDTQIGTGIVKLGTSDAIPNGSAKGNVLLNGTLDLNGFSETINGLSGLGTVDNTSSRSAVLAIGDNNAASTFNGTIRSSGGPVSLIKVGSNYVGISQAQLQFSGDFVVQQGTLVTNTFPSEGNDASLRLGLGTADATFNWNGGSQTISRTLELAGTGNLAISSSGAGPIRINGPVVIGVPGAKTLVLKGGNGLENRFDGVLSDYNAASPTTLKKSDDGTWILSRSNSYTGGTVIERGTLAIMSDTSLGDAAAPITIAGDSTLKALAAWTSVRAVNLGSSATFIFDSNGFDSTFSGTIKATATYGKFTKAGAGTLVLNSAAPMQYNGQTNVIGGTLKVDFANLPSATNLLGTTTQLSLAGGAVEFIQQAGKDTSQKFNGSGLSFNAGASKVIAANAGDTGTISVSLDYFGQVHGATVDFTLPQRGAITTSKPNISYVGGQPTIIAGYATIGGRTWAVTGTGSGVFNITGLSVYEPQFVASKDVDAPAGLSTVQPMTINSLRFSHAGNTDLTLTGNLKIATGGLLVSSDVGSSAITIAGGSLTTAATELSIIQNNPKGDLSISSEISGYYLTKTGPGTVRISGSVSPTNSINVTDGTLNLTGSGSISGSTLWVYVDTPGATGLAEGAKLQIDSPPASFAPGQGIRIGDAGVGTIEQTAGSAILPRLTLGFQQRAIGKYAISGGTLSVQAMNGQGNLDVGSLGTGILDVSAGAKVDIAADLRLAVDRSGIGIVNQSSGTINVTGDVSFGIFTNGNAGKATWNHTGGTLNIGGSLRLGESSTSTLNLNGGTIVAPAVYCGLDYTGNPDVKVNLGGGTLKLTRPATIALPGITLSGSGSTIDSDSRLLLAASLSGSGELNKTGAGALVLNEIAPQFSGAVRINAGKLVISEGGVGSGTVTVGAGAVLSLQEIVPGLLAQVYAGAGTFGGTYDYSSSSNFDAVLKNAPTASAMTSDGGGEGRIFFDWTNPLSALPNSLSQAVRFSGKFLAESEGIYRFSLGNSWTSFMTIDGNQVINNGGSHPLSFVDAWVSLTAGWHDFGIDSFNATSLYGLVTLPDGRQQVLSNSLLGTEFGTSTTIGGLAGSGAVDLGDRTLTTGANDQDAVFSGVIRGKGQLTKVGSGTQILLGSNTYSGATTINAGTLRVDGSIASSSGVTVAASASFVAGANQAVKSLNLSAVGSNATILAGALRVLTVGDNTTTAPLTLTGGTMGLLDINSGAVVIDFTAGNEAANLTLVKNAIIAGRNAGAWNGTTGITSTAAAAASSVYGVGYAPGTVATAAIAGVTPDASSMVARYTRLGDANLDGAVNFFDLTALAAAYGAAGEWYNGDFDYSGAVNFFDLTALAANYGTGLPSEPIPGATPDFIADLAAAFASVPEPGAISLLGLAALALLKRRNHSHNTTRPLRPGEPGA